MLLWPRQRETWRLGRLPFELRTFRLDGVTPAGSVEDEEPAAGREHVVVWDRPDDLLSGIEHQRERLGAQARPVREVAVVATDPSLPLDEPFETDRAESNVHDRDHYHSHGRVDEACSDNRSVPADGVDADGKRRECDQELCGITDGHAAEHIAAGLPVGGRGERRVRHGLPRHGQVPLAVRRRATTSSNARSRRPAR